MHQEATFPGKPERVDDPQQRIHSEGVCRTAESSAPACRVILRAEVASADLPPASVAADANIVIAGHLAGSDQVHVEFDSHLRLNHEEPRGALLEHAAEVRIAGPHP